MSAALEIELGGSQLIDLTPEEYHRDPAPAPSLSASIAKILLDESPLHAWHAHPKLGGVSRPASAAMDRGTLIHKLVLGAGAAIEPIDAKDYKTKAAREARDKARAERKIPVLVHELKEATAAAAAIRANLAEQGIEFTGRSEVACVWEEQTACGPIWCRGLFDHLIERGAAMIIDLKTIRSAHPDACARAVVNYGYDVQQAAYTRAIEKARPELAGRVRFVFAFVETEPPYATTPARITGDFREHGERRWINAIETWASCLSMNNWPGYALDTVNLEPPGWLLRKLED